MLRRSLLLAPLPLFAFQTEEQLIKEIRKSIITLPFYSGFDWIYFKVEGRKVILGGYVNRPTLKDDSKRTVAQVKGVEEVINNIEVLPLSPNDNDIRLRVSRAVSSRSLQRYGLGVIPSIHIIVKNGNVTLYGYVGNEGDKNLANLYASQVPGVFSVVNSLEIDRKPSAKPNSKPRN